jgi:YrbI family 3-deoxy-D-manno-octulosonate 8-phosphate phosphatase
MGVERLRTLINVETGIITGEKSGIVLKRAKKLGIIEYHPSAKIKYAVLQEILFRRMLKPEEIAYIGDDTNDMEIMKNSGLSACPADAFPMVKQIADIILENKGGNGAFREFAELIIDCQLKK